jgi:hypothetical protein
MCDILGGRRDASRPMRYLDFDHVQVAMPRGGADAARRFYCLVLGFWEGRTPSGVAANGGIWLENGLLRLHLGVDPDFRPAQSAHPALVVDDLEALVVTLIEAGHKPRFVAPVRHPTRCQVHDPFGNRLEFIQASAGPAGADAIAAERRRDHTV